MAHSFFFEGGEKKPRKLHRASHQSSSPSQLAIMPQMSHTPPTCYRKTASDEKVSNFPGN